MADSPIDERRFSEEEVQAILKKAVETPATAVARRDDGPAAGLSLAELKAIAGEVGIDPARLEQAARAVVALPDAAAGALGGPTRWHVERTVPGTVDPADTPEVLSAVRRVMGHHGKVNELRGALEWSHSGDGGSQHVTVSSRDGATTVRASANLGQMAVVTFLPAGILGTFATAITMIASAEAGSALGVVAGAAILPAVYGTMRKVFGTLSRRTSARLQQVVDEVAQLPRPGTD